MEMLYRWFCRWWRRFLGLFGREEVHYINGTDTLPPPLSAEEEQSAVLGLQQGDEGARDALITHNLRLVVYIARRFENTGVGIEDLISIGTIGLIKGISTFDGSKGARLATYAARCVENEILMYFRAQRKTSQNVSLSDFIETGSDGAALSLMEVVSDDEDLLERVSTREDIKKLMTALETRLTPQEKQVILLRYGLGGNPPQRQRQVAQTIGVSRSYVSRIEKRALEKLKEVLES